MKFICPACKKILVRDMRNRSNKSCLTKAGRYRSYCDTKGKDVLCRRIK